MGPVNSQILIGTPKETVSFCIMRLIDIENIELCIFDDADIVTTTRLVKDNIINRLQVCRKIFLSSIGLNTIKDYSEKFVSINNEITMNAMQFFIKMIDITEKLNVIIEIYKLLKKFGGRCIVFCNVSIKWFEVV